LNPFASLFFWRNWNDGGQRLRAIVTGVYNDIRWDFLPGHGRLETVFTFQNLTPPFDRSEYVEGLRILSEDLRRYEVHAGAGLGYRRPVSPGHQDNMLEAALTYEPGYLWFDRGDNTDPSYIVPSDTYEGRIHFRFRFDTFERNPSSCRTRASPAVSMRSTDGGRSGRTGADRCWDSRPAATARSGTH
jgi:hypothetical protein